MAIDFTGKLLIYNDYYEDVSNLTAIYKWLDDQTTSRILAA